MRNPINCRRYKWGLAMQGVLLLIFLLAPTMGRAQIQITLKNSFIEQQKNRVTVDATFTVDKAHIRPNPPSKDGDLHIAGRAPEIGLATVAEIMNARDEDAAVTLIHSVEGRNQPIRLSGAWRLWCEHGGESKQIQGAKLAPFDTTNPEHVFEIHPITRLNGQSIVESLRPINGFQAKDAETAFTSYENRKSQIVFNAKKRTTTIVTSMGGFNYVEFRIELNEDPVQVSDGTFVFAKVMDLNEDLLVQKRRMVFVKGTDPEAAIKSLHKGDKLHVLGVPRIDLALVSYRTKHATDTPGILNWNLPYEMLIVAVYPD